MRQLCFIIAILGDDPEDTLARAMVKWLLGQGTHFVFPEGMVKNYSFVFQNVYKQITPTQTKYRPPYPGDRYFYSALSLSSVVPRGR